MQTVISNYFFSRRKIDEGVPIPMRFKSVNEYLENVRSQVFNHLPVAARTDPSDFIQNRLVMAATLEDMTGLTRFMEENFAIKSPTPHLNESERREKVDPVVMQRWRSRNEEEISFYNLVKEAAAKGG